ncbi:MAG: hypothetical protein JL57_26695 [Desulfosporosinus sp. BICA1-9]|nr:MAG: hypothetical protein JL57_26695 [Desulfosporosinus sp. BICA1-9]
MDEDTFLDRQEEFNRYSQHKNTLDNPGYVNNFNNFIIISKIDNLKNVKRALDFGCGPGPVLQVLLEKLGYATDIYDPFFYPTQGFLKKRYDLITCTDVLEHLKNPLATLRILEVLLEKGGILAVTTLFHTSAEDFISWWYRKDPTHITFYSQKTFRWLAEHLNLSLEFSDDKSIGVLKKSAS